MPVSCGNLFRGPQTGRLYTGLQNNIAIPSKHDGNCEKRLWHQPPRSRRINVRVFKETPLTTSRAEAFGERLRDPLGLKAHANSTYLRGREGPLVHGGARIRRFPAASSAVAATSRIRGCRCGFYQFQHIVGGIGFAQARKNLLDAVTMGIGVPIGHRVCHEHNVVAVIVGAAGRRFDADAGRDARQEDLGHFSLVQVIIQRRANKCAGSLLGHEIVVGCWIQLRNKLGPIGRERKLWNSGIGAARSRCPKR